MKYLGIDYSKFPYILEPFRKQLTIAMLHSELSAKKCKKLIKNEDLWKKVNLFHIFDAVDITRDIEVGNTTSAPKKKKSDMERFMDFLVKNMEKDEYERFQEGIQFGKFVDKFSDWINVFGAPSLSELKSLSAENDFEYILAIHQIGEAILASKKDNRKLIDKFLKNYKTLFDNKTIDAFLDVYSAISLKKSQATTKKKSTPKKEK